MAEKSETWTLLKVLDWTREYLAAKGVENARRESEWLLCHVLFLDRMGLYLNFDKPLSEAELAALRALVGRRARREPLQYILGSQEFCGLDFQVEPGVLIPRHDTEVLVEEALRRAPKAGRVLDLGVGSGCIAIALATRLAGAEVVGVDISETALGVAATNATALGVTLDLRRGSFFEAVPGERFDLIVSNPPYIPTAELETLQPEVQRYEPRTALDGGLDGLDCYRQILGQASGHLVPGGWLLVEVGAGQAPAVRDLFAAAGFTAIVTAMDTCSIERVVGGLHS
jgi:release factor glutamine methyltransferase